MSEYLELLAPLERGNGFHQNYISANLGRFVILRVMTSERKSKMSRNRNHTIYALITQLHQNESVWNWVQQRKGNRKIGFLFILFA